VKKIQVVQQVLRANDTIAQQNRKRFADAGVVVLNFISAPGSGKTTLLERTLENLKGVANCAVLVGDLATTHDAERLGRHCDHVVQINTGKGCHLDAPQIEAALQHVPLERLDWLFIENVGNLVCPTQFDLGEHAKIALVSVVEGEDKVVKYPILFAQAACVLLTKTDLAEAAGFDSDRFYRELSQVNSSVPVIEISARTGAGLDRWLAWLGDFRETVAGKDA